MNNLFKTIFSGFVTLSLAVVSQAQTITIGSQEWTSANLNVSEFRNGEAIPEANSADAWTKAAQSGQAAWCYYDFNVANAERYGKLYNFYAVSDPRGLAPLGWRVPDINDNKVLIEALGGYEGTGTKLKSKGIKGNNKSGFNALGAGRCGADGQFKDLKDAAYFWLTDPAVNNKAGALELYPGNENPALDLSDRGTGFSVRCVKNSGITEAIVKMADGSAVTTVQVGNQTWFSQNLATAKFRNGDDILQAKSAKEWASAANSKTPVWAYANFDAQNAKYGKLYNFYAVNDARGLAPEGYHVPTNEEWKKLISAAGGEKAGNAIRALSGWEISEKQFKTATNSTGFSAFPLPKIWDDGTYQPLAAAEWWSTTLSGNDAYFYNTTYTGPNLSEMAGDNFGCGHAVRCVKD